MDDNRDHDAARDKFMTFIRDEYANKGVFLSIASSMPRRIIMKCDRGGTYRDHRKADSKTKPILSRLTGCEFKVILKYHFGQWTADVSFPYHNHEVVNTNSSLSRKCGKCGRPGHNMRSCLATPRSHLISNTSNHYVTESSQYSTDTDTKEPRRSLKISDLVNSSENQVTRGFSFSSTSEKHLKPRSILGIDHNVVVTHDHKVDGERDIIKNEL